MADPGADRCRAAHAGHCHRRFRIRARAITQRAFRVVAPTFDRGISKQRTRGADLGGADDTGHGHGHGHWYQEHAVGAVT